jgi:hypothetical protein
MFRLTNSLTLPGPKFAVDGAEEAALHLLLFVDGRKIEVPYNTPVTDVAQEVENWLVCADYLLGGAHGRLMCRASGVCKVAGGHRAVAATRPGPRGTIDELAPRVHGACSGMSWPTDKHVASETVFANCSLPQATLSVERCRVEFLSISASLVPAVPAQQ